MPVSKEIIKENLAINLKFFAYYFHEETNGIPFRTKKVTSTFRKWLKEKQPLVYEALIEKEKELKEVRS